MKIFAFTGWSGSGKTTLISSLIRELAGRGHRVIAAKHVPEKFHIEPEGKDSSVFLDSGASPVYLVGRSGMMRMEPLTLPGDFIRILNSDSRKADFILLEGFRNYGFPLIEVFDPEISPDLKADPLQLTAVICEKRNFEGIPQFGRNDISEIADFLESLKGKGV